jgi:hypothetical protein
MQIFSKINLRKEYFQIFMYPDDIPKTAIILSFGLFEFLRLPFDLRNAGPDPVDDGPGFWPDFPSSLSTSTSLSLEQHEKDVEEVFRCLRSAGLVINGEKCEFAVWEV